MRGEVVEVGLKEPERLRSGVRKACMQRRELYTHQKSAIDRLFAQIYYEFLQCHGIIVDGDEQMAQLGQEELDLVIAELAQLGA
jgi:hypothetical protein